VLARSAGTSGGRAAAAAGPPAPPSLGRAAQQQSLDFASAVVGLVRGAAQQAAAEVAQAQAGGEGSEAEGEPTSAPAASEASSPTADPTAGPTADPTAGPTDPAPPPTASPVAAAAAPSERPTTGGAISAAPSAAAPVSQAPVAAAPAVPGAIEEGATPGGVEYYRCRASTDAERTILLFHGASLTREQWKTSGILDDLCGRPGLTVYALDLSVASDAVDLKALMDDLASSNLVFRLPVDAVVTPSASGSMVVDWGGRTYLANASFAPMASYWSLWVPVACPSVSSVDPPDKLGGMFPGVEILAVHGDQDASGGRVMQRLETYAGATLVTIDGGHACYMQSPGDFVDAVLAAMGMQ
jgi:hypothetical protein